MSGLKKPVIYHGKWGVMDGTVKWAWHCMWNLTTVMVTDTYMRYIMKNGTFVLIV